jgi:putative transposase
MDFVSDQLFDSHRIRVLVIVENHTRECLALEANVKIRGIDVVTMLERITQEQGFPKRIKVDNGPEFISKDLDRWAYWNKVELDLSRPGKPSDNALVEAFNSRFRQECLNQHWFMSLEDAKTKLHSWQKEYNTERPHSSLGYLSPIQSEPKFINEKATAA